MPFHLDDALNHLSGPTVLPVPEGAPAWEFARSRAAAVIGELAARAGLFQFHFEHRVGLEVPEAWLDPERPAPEPLEWRDGVLPEPKYQAFRHDLPIGSFHPGHRAKWSAHELCHALVGFAWTPDASPLFHATAARLAELVPVVLWYFLDEIGLARCERHRDPLFRAWCPDCEALAAAGSGAFDPSDATERLTDAVRFVRQELDAVAVTRRLGRPAPHVWGSLDLCSDGIAYAEGHARRLAAPSFHDFADRFLVTGDPASHPTLEALEARVTEVFEALAAGRPLALPRGDRSRWVAWDLGQRLLQVREQTEGDASHEILALVDRLARGHRPVDVAAAWSALGEAYVLPPTVEVFGVGYAIDGVRSRSVAQVEEGLGTVTPLVMDLARDADVDLVEAFVAQDGPVRRPLGDRFADWLGVGPVADLARYESSVRHAGGEAEAQVLGAGEGLRLAHGARAARFDFDVVRFAERVGAGEIEGHAVHGAIGLPDGEPPAGGLGLVFGRSREGELIVAEVAPDQVDRIVLDPAGLPADVAVALAALGLLVPRRWTLTT